MNAITTTIAPQRPAAWEEKSLKELAVFEKGHVVATQPHARTGSLPYIGADSFTGSFSQFTDDKTATTCEPSDVLMLWDGERSGLCAGGLSGAIGSTVVRLRSRQGVNGRFLYFQLARHFDWIQARRTGTGVPHVPKDLATLLRVPVPIEIAEQSRIAAVLETVDEAIAKTEAVIAKLRQVRAGLVHNLLTRGLDRNGELRDSIARPELFQDSALGQIPKEWNVQTLECCVSSEITYGIVQAGPHVEGGVPYIRTGDMNGDRLVAEQMLRTSPEIASRFRRSRVQTGEIVCAIRATVGKVLPVPPELDGANLTQGTARIAPKNDVDSSFLLWAIRGDRTQQEMAREVKGTTFFEITLADLRKTKIAIPRESEEQRQIAGTIQALEVRLANDTDSLSKLQNLKSGLMTDLLTGRVRVPETIGTAP